jgi:hypothetical protein
MQTTPAVQCVCPAFICRCKCVWRQASLAPPAASARASAPTTAPTATAGTCRSRAPTTAATRTPTSPGWLLHLQHNAVTAHPLRQLLRRQLVLILLILLTTDNAGCVAAQCWRLLSECGATISITGDSLPSKLIITISTCWAKERWA